MLDIFSFKQESSKSDDERNYLVQIGGQEFTLSNKLESVVNALEPGTAVHWVSNGDWSMHEMLLALLQRTGPAAVIISSYAFSETPARIIADLVEQRIITSLQCLIDSRVDTRSASAHNLILSASTAHRLAETHAKVTCIHNKEFAIAIIGSANYTTNRRYEAGIVVHDQDAFDFHFNWLKKAIHGTNGNGAEAN